MESIEKNKDSLILHYAAISAKALNEENPVELDNIKHEQSGIEATLGMTKEEIIIRAAELTTQ